MHNGEWSIDLDAKDDFARSMASLIEKFNVQGNNATETIEEYLDSFQQQLITFRMRGEASANLHQTLLHNVRNNTHVVDHESRVSVLTNEQKTGLDSYVKTIGEPVSYPDKQAQSAVGKKARISQVALYPGESFLMPKDEDRGLGKHLRLKLGIRTGGRSNGLFIPEVSTQYHTGIGVHPTEETEPLAARRIEAITMQKLEFTHKISRALLEGIDDDQIRKLFIAETEHVAQRSEADSYTKKLDTIARDLVSRKKKLKEPQFVESNTGLRLVLPL